jgi:PAS domain-containing protein
MQARLRFSRRRGEARFGGPERDLLAQLTPHLRRAVEIHARLNRASSERDVYAGAVSQLSVATIILDEQGRVLTANEVGEAILGEADGIARRDGHLHIDGRDSNRELQHALTTIIRAQQRGEAAIVRALRVARQGRADLGLIVRPVPASPGAEGQAIPRAAVFISDPDREASTSQQILAELFDLTPA